MFLRAIFQHDVHHNELLDGLFLLLLLKKILRVVFSLERGLNCTFHQKPVVDDYDFVVHDVEFIVEFII